jgi:hypothetical protein
MDLTPEKAIGMKFELWLRNYLRQSGCKDVLFDVRYHKSKYLKRQADLVFTESFNGYTGRVIVEAKYSSNGLIKYNLRQGFKAKAGSRILTNLVDEILERQNFAKSDRVYKSILVTNKYFEDELIMKALKNKIYLIDGEKLFRDYKRFGGRYNSLDQAIRAVDLDKFNPDDIKPTYRWIK